MERIVNTFGFVGEQALRATHFLGYRRFTGSLVYCLSYRRRRNRTNYSYHSAFRRSHRSDRYSGSGGDLRDQYPINSDYPYRPEWLCNYGRSWQHQAQQGTRRVRNVEGESQLFCYYAKNFRDLLVTRS